MIVVSQGLWCLQVANIYGQLSNLRTVRFKADTICMYQKKYVMHSKIQLSVIQLVVPLVGYLFLKEYYCGKETRCRFVIVKSVTKLVVLFFCVLLNRY
jgi:hypothetical protein